MSGDSSTSWPQDSVLNTPTSLSRTPCGISEKPKYDSDDQSSMMSEPGSPQDIAMSSDDENTEEIDDDDGALYYTHSPQQSIASSPWQARMQANRVPTPIIPPIRTGIRQHIRRRHPQETKISSSDLLEVPSPVDEADMPTPPSAAEAAGSQLSMLSFSDMDMEDSDPALPTISVGMSHSSWSAERTPRLSPSIDHSLDPDKGLFIRKQRARSGALSNGNGSPVPPDFSVGASKRGFSMGFRADCEKCQMRVPGHMNHFVA